MWKVWALHFSAVSVEIQNNVYPHYHPHPSFLTVFLQHICKQFTLPPRHVQARGCLGKAWPCQTSLGRQQEMSPLRAAPSAHLALGWDGRHHLPLPPTPVLGQCHNEQLSCKIQLCIRLCLKPFHTPPKQAAKLLPQKLAPTLITLCLGCIAFLINQACAPRKMGGHPILLWNPTGVASSLTLLLQESLLASPEPLPCSDVSGQTSLGLLMIH